MLLLMRSFINSYPKAQCINNHFEKACEEIQTGTDQFIKNIQLIKASTKHPFRFIITSPVCSIKPLSKDITSALKLFDEKKGKKSCKRKSMIRNRDLLDYSE